MFITHKYSTDKQHEHTFSLWTKYQRLYRNVMSLPPSLWSSQSLLCTALTHYSPVCFVPCLADGPEISPEQEEGAVPTYLSRPPRRRAQCLFFSAWLFVSFCVCLSVYHCPVLCVLFSVLSFWWTVGIFLNPALYCWRWNSLWRSLPLVSSPFTIFSFHIRHVVTPPHLAHCSFCQTACDGRKAAAGCRKQLKSLWCFEVWLGLFSVCFLYL